MEAVCGSLEALLRAGLLQTPTATHQSWGKLAKLCLRADKHIRIYEDPELACSPATACRFFKFSEASLWKLKGLQFRLLRSCPDACVVWRVHHCRIAGSVGVQLERLDAACSALPTPWPMWPLPEQDDPIVYPRQVLNLILFTLHGLCHLLLTLKLRGLWRAGRRQRRGAGFHARCGAGASLGRPVLGSP